MGCIAGGLGALGVGDGVLDGVLIKVQLVGEFTEHIVIGVAQIHPQQRAVLVQVIGNIGEREVFGLQLAAEPQPGPDTVRGRVHNCGLLETAGLSPWCAR